MKNIIERYSRENGYTLVLNASTAGTPVVYGSNQITLPTILFGCSIRVTPSKPRQTRLNIKGLGPRHRPLARSLSEINDLKRLGGN